MPGITKMKKMEEEEKKEEGGKKKKKIIMVVPIEDMLHVMFCDYCFRWIYI